MIVKMLTALVLTAGFVAAATNAPVSEPTRCTKNAYCCSVGRSCCPWSAKTTEMTLAQAKEFAIDNSKAQPTCCTKNAYCCSVNRSCCPWSKKTAGMTSAQAKASVIDKSKAEPTCCTKRAYCCSVGRSCCH